MGQGLRLVGVEQDDVADGGLLVEQLQPESDPVDGVGILASGQAMSRTSVSEVVFFSRTLSRDLEIGTPCRPISSTSRGKVQLGRS